MSDRRMDPKDPEAEAFYYFDFRPDGLHPFLAEEETIADFDVTADEVEGLEVSNKSEQTGVVSALLSGGTAGVTYPVKCVITTSAGRTEVVRMFVPVRPT